MKQTIYKDISVSRVPRLLVARLEKDSQHKQVSISAIVRAVLMRHYKLTKQGGRHGNHD